MINLEPTMQSIVDNVFNTSTTNYVVTTPGSYYNTACEAEGFCQKGQYLVIGYRAWFDWFNEQANDEMCTYVPPIPLYCADKYIHAVQVSNILNEEQERL